MEPSYQAISTLDAVEEIVTKFKTSREIYQKWRERRRRKQPAEEELEVSLVLGAEKLKSRSKELQEIWGSAFNRGDDISRDGLLETSRTINSSLVQVLRNSLEPVQMKTLRPQPLWRISETCRDQTIAILCDLGHRLRVAARGPVFLRGTRPIIQRSPHQSPEAFVDARRVSDSLLPARQPAVRPSFIAPSSQIESVSPAIVLYNPDTAGCSNADQPIDKSVSELLREWRQDLDARELLRNPPSPSTTPLQVAHFASNISGISADPVAPKHCQGASSILLRSCSSMEERNQDRVDRPRREPFYSPLLQMSKATYSTTSLDSGFSTRIVSCPSRGPDMPEDD